MNQEVQEAHHQELLMSQTRHPYLLPLVTQVVVQIILVVVAMVTLAPSVVTVVRQVDMVLIVDKVEQAVLGAMGLEEI
jgi:hypothetical protein|tara:strand:- start:263 stop:496 length:234 start_codon:yes stop_codon:yes gene_type:complete